MRALKRPSCAGATVGCRGALQDVEGIRLHFLRSRCHMHRMLQPAANPDDIRWLPGARLNVAESALCVRDPDVPAVIWATEEAPDVLHTLSLGELRREAMRFAAALRAAGFSPGARKLPKPVSRSRHVRGQHELVSRQHNRIDSSGEFTVHERRVSAVL